MERRKAPLTTLMGTLGLSERGFSLRDGLNGLRKAWVGTGGLCDRDESVSTFSRKARFVYWRWT